MFFCVRINSESEQAIESSHENEDNEMNIRNIKIDREVTMVYFKIF